MKADAYKNISSELIGIARSYYDHRDRLVYSAKANTFLSGGELLDVEHGMRGRIDCSTYIHLILQGIPYEESPYVHGDPETFYHSGCSWAVRDLADQLRKGAPVRRAHQLAKYYYDRGLCMTGKDWKPGDLLFFQVREEKVDHYLSFNIFKAIFHIGIVGEDRDHMYESSGHQTKDVEKNYTEPAIRRSLISERGMPIFYVQSESL